jgi:hypothetical protein
MQLPPALRYEHKLRVFENGILRSKFELNRDELNSIKKDENIG